MAITGFLEKVVVSAARSGHDTPMHPGRRFELLAVVLLLDVGGGMPVAAHPVVGGGLAASGAPAIR